MSREFCPSNPSRMNTRSRPRGRRGFTVLEAVLASVIGAMILMTCFGLILGVQKVESVTRVSGDQTIELTRAHRSLQHAFREIVVADGRALAQANAAAGGGGANGLTPEIVGAGGGGGSVTGFGSGGAPVTATVAKQVGRTVPLTGDELARERLGQGLPSAQTESTENRKDASANRSGPESTVRMSEGFSNGAGFSSGFGSSDSGADAERARAAPPGPPPPPRVILGPQADGAPSLELLVAQPPVALPASSDPALQFALTRGAFVLRPSDLNAESMTTVGAMPPVNTDPATVPAGGYDLAWETYALGSAQAPERAIVGRVVLCRHVSAMDLRFFKTNAETMKLEPTTVTTVSGLRDLPAYAEVEMALTTGQRVKWLFEIGWTTGGEPTGDTVQTASTEREGETAGARPIDAAGGARSSSFSTPSRPGVNLPTVNKEAMKAAGKR
ncbi:hypothetical protein BH11PLA1_BH11PLA1_15090 [soil metagenome]